jgi:hypothetical protein
LVLEVVKIAEGVDRIRIIRCNRAGVVERGRVATSAKPSRFNGKRGGYQFVGAAAYLQQDARQDVGAAGGAP